MNVLQGALLGLIQGLGEFLPISSSGHLLLARFFLGIQGETADAQAAFKVLDILLHVGTLIPLLIIFWKDWIEMLRHPVKNKTLIYLIVASVPTLGIYFAAKVLFPSLHGFSVFDSGWFLGASFLITAFFLLACDLVSSRRGSSTKGTIPRLEVVTALASIGLLAGDVGVFQPEHQLGGAILNPQTHPIAVGYPGAEIVGILVPVAVFRTGFAVFGDNLLLKFVEFRNDFTGFLQGAPTLSVFTQIGLGGND